MRKNKFPTSFPFFVTLRIILSMKLLIVFSFDIFDNNNDEKGEAIIYWIGAFSVSIVSHIVQLALVCETHDFPKVLQIITLVFERDYLFTF